MQPEGNFYDKYHSKNPIVKWMMRGFFEDMKELLQIMDCIPGRILETGCGEGEVTAFLKSEYPEALLEAFDISEKIIGEVIGKKLDINFYVGNIYTMKIRNVSDSNWKKLDGNYDLVVCSEVLEHLDEPEKAIQRILEMTSKYVLLSVPNEPIWRILNMLRGKYWNSLGNTPGHVQHWNRKSFCKELEKNGLKILAVRRPFPWTMVLALKG